MWKWKERAMEYQKRQSYQSHCHYTATPPPHQLTWQAATFHSLGYHYHICFWPVRNIPWICVWHLPNTPAPLNVHFMICLFLIVIIFFFIIRLIGFSLPSFPLPALPPSRCHSVSVWMSPVLCSVIPRDIGTGCLLLYRVVAVVDVCLLAGQGCLGREGGREKNTTEVNRRDLHRQGGGSRASVLGWQVVSSECGVSKAKLTFFCSVEHEVEHWQQQIGHEHHVAYFPPTLAPAVWFHRWLENKCFIVFHPDQYVNSVGQAGDAEQPVQMRPQ